MADRYIRAVASSQTQDPVQTCWENFANAIIAKACDDYFDLKCKGFVDTQGSKQANLDSITRFFRSQWFAELTDLDPEFLIEKLNKLAQEEIKRRRGGNG